MQGRDLDDHGLAGVGCVRLVFRVGDDLQPLVDKFCAQGVDCGAGLAGEEGVRLREGGRTVQVDGFGFDLDAARAFDALDGARLERGRGGGEGGEREDERLSRISICR